MAVRSCCATIWALLLPPVGVFLMAGCGWQLCINICLTLLCFIPGMIHALFVVCVTDEREGEALPTTQPYANAQGPYPQQPPSVGVPVPAYPAGAQPAGMVAPVAMPPQQHHAYPPPPSGYPPQAPPPAGYPPQKF